MQCPWFPNWISNVDSSDHRTSVQLRLSPCLSQDGEPSSSFHVAVIKFIMEKSFSKNNQTSPFQHKLSLLFQCFAHPHILFSFTFYTTCQLSLNQGQVIFCFVYTYLCPYVCIIWTHYEKIPVRKNTEWEKKKKKNIPCVNNLQFLSTSTNKTFCFLTSWLCDLSSSHFKFFDF